MAILTATSAGIVTGYFDVPAGVPAGSKRVQFYGATSYAEATFVGRATTTVRELQRVNMIQTTESWTWAGDPVAQTFTLQQDTMVSGVDIQFSAKGTSNVVCCIRETSNGMPTQRQVASAIKTPAQITANGSGAQTWTRFTWPAVKLTANQEYAICLFCDDATAAVRYAELGKYDALNQRWITEQAYLVGVMLTSSNANTWTPNQTSDLTFRLLMPTYTPYNTATYRSQRVVTMNSASVTSADYLIVNAAVERPMRATDCVFQIKTYPTTATTNVYSVTEGQPLLLPVQYTGKVDLSMVLTGSLHVTPRVQKDVRLVYAVGTTTSTYISRAIPCNATSASSSKMTVNMTARLPQGADVAVSAQVGTDASNQPVWSTAFVSASAPVVLQNGWTERSYSHSGFSLSETRIRLTLTGTVRARPEIRGLQASVVSV